VFPSNSQNNVSNCLVGNTPFSSQFRVALINCFSSDFSNIVRRKWGVPVSLSKMFRGKTTSSLFSHVFQVVRSRPFEHVGRVATNRIVALVAQTVAWPLTNCQKPSHSVSKLRFLSCPTNTVSLSVDCSCPDPTTIWTFTIDSFPKPGNVSWVHRSLSC
jgi:hypothetical protein